MLPGDRLVCALVGNFKVGDEFTRWPLHVTIVPWFRLDDLSEQIAEGLTKALTTIKPFEVVIGESALFGPRKRPAHVLKRSDLTEVEKRVRKYFHQKRAWLVDETTKKKYNFRPHITYQGEEHMASEDRVTIDRLFIVQQHGDHKAVESVVKFKP
jgi:2'-5' RNA ligase